MQIAFFVRPGLRAGANYQSFLSFEAAHTRARRGAFAIKSEARPCLLKPHPLAFPKVAFPRPPVSRSRFAASLRASSCTRRSPPRRRTIRIPISLPASLSTCGRVRYSNPVRWITCILDEGNRRCRHYRFSSVSLRRHRRIVHEMCESPPGLPLQVCESFHSYRSHWSGYRGKKN